MLMWFYNRLGATASTAAGRVKITYNFGESSKWIARDRQSDRFQLRRRDRIDLSVIQNCRSPIQITHRSDC